MGCHRLLIIVNQDRHYFAIIRLIILKTILPLALLVIFAVRLVFLLDQQLLLPQLYLLH